MDPREGGGGGGDLLPKTAQDCNRLVADSFIGAGGYAGSGGFRPPDLEFAAYRNACLLGLRARQQNTGGSISKFPTPAPAAKPPAPTAPPFIFVLIAAILFIGKGWN